MEYIDSGESGGPEELMDEFGLGVRDLKDAVKRAVSRKGN